jgi:glycosyltransferase involved in cell wall biosynthesis
MEHRPSAYAGGMEEQALTDRTKLAIIGGFLKPRAAVAHGTHHASYIACQALSAVGCFSVIHVYHELPLPPGRASDLFLPNQPPTRVFDKTALPESPERYLAIYVANGEQIGPAPHLLRPHDDWAPVICNVGSAHSGAQWHSLLVALASGAIRSSDGFVFKSEAARGLFRDVWTDWSDRFRLAPSFPESSVVIPNGVDVERHQRSPALRAEARALLRLSDQDVVFLAFSRLSPGTKGDQQALIVRWKEVLAQFPHAVLVLAGTQVDRRFTMEQRHLARAAGVADRVLVLENPFELLADARASLMSAADVFVHLTTGTEEVSPLVTHEAMAFGLPVIATRWAGNPEVVVDGVNGYLIATRAAPVSSPWNIATFAMTDLPVGLASSRSVYCAFDQFVAQTVALADNQRRQAMGEAARRSIEARSAAIVARTQADYIRLVARHAHEQWSGRSTFRPLITMDQVLAAQTRGRLTGSERVRLANVDRAALLTAGWQPEDADPVGQVLATLGQRQETSVEELAAVIQPTGAACGESSAAALRRVSSLLVRLLNYGVVRLVS